MQHYRKLETKRYADAFLSFKLLAMALCLRLPTSLSREAQAQWRLKREVVQLKQEMNATSSQDEFAKWAKLRRKHDKTMEEYEVKSALNLFLILLFLSTSWEKIGASPTPSKSNKDTNISCHAFEDKP